MTKEKLAFTLAEVLITLGIIGVVAAITMPILIGNYQKKVIQTALKKTNSELAQAVNMLMFENGNTLAGLCTTNKDHDCFAEKLAQQLKINKLCHSNNSDNDNCWSYTGLFSGAKNRPHIILADGRLLQIYHTDAKCSEMINHSQYKDKTLICASTYVDINGLKSPNELGKDIFAFVITNGSVIPLGSPTITKDAYSLGKDRCESSNSRNEFCTYYYMLGLK